MYRNLHLYNLIEYSIWDSEDKNRIELLEKNKNITILGKHLKSLKYEQIRKLSMLINLKAVRKMLFIKIKLKVISLAKEIFILDINLGNKIYVPKEININKFPSSYRYYDFILQFIQEYISILKKTKITNQAVDRARFDQTNNVKAKFMAFVNMDIKKEKLLVQKVTVNHSIKNYLG